MLMDGPISTTFFWQLLLAASGFWHRTWPWTVLRPWPAHTCSLFSTHFMLLAKLKHVLLAGRAES